jgi:hypothetical protein
MLALRALKLLSENIRTVLTSPQDTDAREAMLLGSMFAGAGICKRTRRRGARAGLSCRRTLPHTARAQ